MGKQVSSRAPSHVRVIQEDKCHHSSHPPPSFYFPHLYMLSMMPCGWAIPLISWGQLSWLLSSLNFLCPNPPQWWCTVRGRKAFHLCKHCSAVNKTSLYCQHCFQHKPKAAPYQKLTPSQTKPSQPFLLLATPRNI